LRRKRHEPAAEEAGRQRQHACRRSAVHAASGKSKDETLCDQLAFQLGRMNRDFISQLQQR
jgi:hypothetical protein